MTFETGGYPRPQLRRDNWLSLDGQWEFALDPQAQWTRPDSVAWTQTIRVPFAPETPASGLSITEPFSKCWYRRTFRTQKLQRDQRLILHFGAVDYVARVFINGEFRTKC